MCVALFFRGLQVSLHSLAPQIPCLCVLLPAVHISGIHSNPSIIDHFFSSSHAVLFEPSEAEDFIEEPRAKFPVWVATCTIMITIVVCFYSFAVELTRIYFVRPRQLVFLLSEYFVSALGLLVQRSSLKADWVGLVLIPLLGTLSRPLFCPDIRFFH